MDIFLFFLIPATALVGLIFWVCWPEKDGIDTNPFS